VIGCFAGLLFTMFSRLVFMTLWIAGYMSQIEGWQRIVGMLLAPCTVIAYSYAMTSCGGVMSTGPGLLAMILGVALDGWFYYVWSKI
jgi:hypothetical protein